jgi:hypothetical protein
MDNSGWNMYVFRDGRRIVPGQRLVAELREALAALEPGPRLSTDRLLDALVAAGELECALTDAGSELSELAVRAAAISDAVAGMLVGAATAQAEDENASSRGDSIRQLLTQLESVAPPSQLQLSVHEGFAYYALHPLKILDLLQDVLPRDVLSAPAAGAGFAPGGVPVAVLGIRSIGVALSAVLMAALQQRGYAAERITVRPTGHPYDRKLTLDRQQMAWVEAHRGAEFMVIDEGPGLSGSSFLAAAEGLVSAGAPRQRILLIGSRQPDIAQLRSPNAVERWSRFRFTCMASHPYCPEGAAIAIGGGVWRQQLLAECGDPPACWTQLEMAKFLSADRELFYKFEGFGHFGGDIGKRASALAAAALGPAYLGNESGFGIYRVSRGRGLKASHLSALRIRHLAAYCAFRLREFKADDSQPSAIDEMASWNWSLEFGEGGEGGDPPGFGPVEVEHRVFCDAHMMPHEWLELGDGRLLKLDGAAHGDDHFFPGPCDIAWDLAGAIVEWKLNGPEAEYFLEQYRRLSGDDARRRLPPYLRAYVSFRLGWCKMAALASTGSFDEPLLWRDFERYRRYAEQLSTRSEPAVQAIAGLKPESPQAEAKGSGATLI